MAKIYRRFIKINGVLEGSPEFATKKDADDWYNERKAEREKIKRGKKSAFSPTFLEFTAFVMKQWIVDYEKPTWQGYESNIRLHLLPELKDYRVDEITRAKCREVLQNVVRNGHSVNHRKHVQTTLSKIFTAAMNTEPPIREDNPCYKLTFDGKRRAKTFQRAFIETEAEVAAFMRTALDLSDQHYIIACIGFMAALRRGEIIGLRWKSLRPHASEIRVSEVYRDAMNKITESTKSGEQTYRDIPVPSILMDALKAYRTRSEFNKDNDFILAGPGGRNLRSKEIHDLFDEIRTKAERPDLTTHSMRHTYGRLFAAKNSGNTKALQAIFGHSSQAMTGKYSEMTTKQVKPLAENMSYKISDTFDTDDTKTTQRCKKS
jgi:integrase